MLHRIAVAAATLIIVFWATAAHAADCVSPHKCANLSDDATRLACYDGLMKAATSDPDERAKNFWGPPRGKMKPAAKGNEAGQSAARDPKMTESSAKASIV